MGLARWIMEFEVHRAIEVSVAPPHILSICSHPVIDSASCLNFTGFDTAAERSEERCLVPSLRCAARNGLVISGRCFPDDPWNQRSQVLADIVSDLDSEHLGGVHLAVEKLNDALQFRRNLVRDEDHTNFASLKICLHHRPVAIGITSVYELSHPLSWIRSLRVAMRLECGSDRFNRPVDDSIRGVVQHLPNHLAPDAGVGASLDFNQGGDS